MSVGILVHGDNHFIVRRPEPDLRTAAMMAHRWSVIQIGVPAKDQNLISTREFREDLEWAIVVPGEGEMSAGVTKLLDELQSRGIIVRVANSQEDPEAETGTKNYEE